MGRQASGKSRLIAPSQETNENVSAVILTPTAQGAATNTIGNVDVMTNLGSCGRKRCGLGLCGQLS